MNTAIALILGLATLVNATPLLNGKPHLKVMGDKIFPMWDAPGTLIVGGEEATPNEFPWMVSMRTGGGIGSHNCGGSLITPEWVVTAAHCVGNSPSSYQIVAGEHNFDVISGREQRRQVVNVIQHESYDRPLPIENDIALMLVSPPFDINQYVQPANLPGPDFQPTANATVAGWGRLYGGGPTPTVLQKVDLPHLNDSVCHSIYPGQIANSMVCYGGGADKSACHGDSGGPLMGGPNNTLIGIVSWGSSQCAQQGRPNVYTRVTSYVVDWIRPRITPQAEDAAPLANVTSCGAHVDESSGLVTLQNLTSSCIVILETPRDALRVRLLESSLVDGDVILARQILGGQPGNNSEISGIGRNHTLPGGLVLLTVILNPNVTSSNRSLQLEYYTSGYSTSTSLTGVHSLSGSSSPGNFSYPIGGGNYQNNENVLITLGGAQSVNFTRVDLEGSYPNCPYDSVTVLALQGGQYVQAARTCGSTIPSPINLPDGVAIINFVTDSSILATGFTINYS